MLGEQFESYCEGADLPSADLSGKRRQPLPKKYSSAFRGTRELLERDSGVGIRCAADVLASYAASYGLVPEDLAASGRVSAEALTRDITDLAGAFPPRLSQPMVLRARAQLGVGSGFSPFGNSLPDSSSSDSPQPCSTQPDSSQPGERTPVSPQTPALDLPGGALNPNPGWGPYRTADDAARRVYTSAEFATRRGDHPRQSGLRRKKPAGAGPKEAGSELVELIQFQQELADTDPSQEERVQESAEKTNRPTFLKTRDQLDATSLQVLDEFSKDPSRPLYYGELADALDKAPQYLMAALTELQLAGYIDLLPDERYQLQADPEEQ